MAAFGVRAAAVLLRRIPRLLAVAADGALPRSQTLRDFMLGLPAGAPHRDLLCRAVVASTFLAGMELTRDCRVVLEQERPWQTIGVTLAQPWKSRADETGKFG